MNCRPGLLRVRDALALLDEPRHEDAAVAVALDERVNGVAVGGDRRLDELPARVFEHGRLAHDTRAAAHCHLERGLRVVDEDRDILDAVAVQRDVARDLVVRLQTGRQNEAQLVLLEQVADAIADARFGPGIGDLFETERRHIIMCCLLGVADVKLDVVPVDLCEGVAARFGRRTHGAHLAKPRGRPCRSKPYDDIHGDTPVRARGTQRADRLCGSLSASPALAERGPPRLCGGTIRRLVVGARPLHRPRVTALRHTGAARRSALGDRR